MAKQAFVSVVEEKEYQISLESCIVQQNVRRGITRKRVGNITQERREVNMKELWARRIVNNWFRTVTVGLHTAWFLLTPRQSKFLHLQRQCYSDCGYCYEEAMQILERGGESD